MHGPCPCVRLSTSESMGHASNLEGDRACETNSLTVAGQHRILTGFPPARRITSYQPSELGAGCQISRQGRSTSPRVNTSAKKGLPSTLKPLRKA
jgi:hypothetical protein